MTAPDSGAAAHCRRCSQGQFFDQERTVCECPCHALVDYLTDPDRVLRPEHSDGSECAP